MSWPWATFFGIPWPTFFEIGSDIAGVPSGICLLIPALRSNKLQEGIAKLDSDVQALRAAGGAVAPPAAQMTAPAPPAQDGAVQLIYAAIEAARQHLAGWSKRLSTLLRVGSFLLIVAFGMKLVFYWLRP